MKNKALKISLIVILSLMLAVVIGVISTVFVVTHSADYVNFDESKLNNINSKLSILDASGNVADLPMYIDSKKQVCIFDLKQYTIDAFISIEDKRFYSHSGLDIKRIAGATLHNIAAMDYKEGASTISQQLIKNTHLSNSKNLKRKINEMILARQLEQKFSKDKILEMYLNTIYFGYNAYGIENASNMYFGKSASQLTLSESALLAGMIKSPNNYAPTKNLEKSCERRDLVLKTMISNEFISEEDFQSAKAEKIVCKEINTNSPDKSYSYGVITEACALLNMTPMQLINSSFTISTYYDEKCQQALEEAVAADNTLCIGGNKANAVAAVSENGTNGIKAFYCRGNADFFSKRQIGSTAKPFAVYAPAFENKDITTASLVLDEQTNFGGYTPKNFGDKYFGWTTVKNALVNSSNVVSVKVLNNLGTDKSTAYLKNMGFEIDDEQNLSMALGNINGGVNGAELLQAYSTLASGGVSQKTSFIKSISNEKGHLYLRRNTVKKVFSPTTCFLVTDMLTDAVKSGTAKNVGNHNFQIGAKTGTVGTENGNSDALLCGYTTSDTFTFWMQGELPNSVTGSSAPSKAAANFLAKYYKGSRPSDFVAPKDVVSLEIDKVELQQNQQIKIANQMTLKTDKENFYFHKDNCPKEYSSRNITAKPELDVEVSENKVTINLATSLFEIRLYKILPDGIVVELTTDGKVYIDREIEKGKSYLYYAEMYNENVPVGASKKYSVTIPDNEEKPDKNPKDKPSIELPLEYWYFPIG